MEEANRPSEVSARPFDPVEADAAFVHHLRTQSLLLITDQNSLPKGRLAAWEAVRSFADALLPQATEAFLERLRALLCERNGGSYPSRKLWRECCEEMRRQGRLGQEAVLFSQEDFGTGLITGVTSDEK